jgi:hypothetical protein
VFYCVLTSIGLFSPQRKDYFILDPAFPKRLTKSAYSRTLEFIQHMFVQYAQAGLSRRSDKKVAISGLLQRMQEALSSECVYGTFACFRSHLLLWRVPDVTDHGTAGAGNTKDPLPSWSWMSHDHIEFFLKEMIEVPSGAVSFNKQQLHVWIFELQNCDMEDQGERRVLLYDGRQELRDDQEVGEFWFDDTPAKFGIQHCVVIGKSVSNMDAWFVLLVSAVDKERYKRIGVGRVQPLYISDGFVKGVLI